MNINLYSFISGFYGTDFLSKSIGATQIGNGSSVVGRESGRAIQSNRALFFATRDNLVPTPISDNNICSSYILSRLLRYAAEQRFKRVLFNRKVGQRPVEKQWQITMAYRYLSDSRALRHFQTDFQIKPRERERENRIWRLTRSGRTIVGC